MGSCQDNLNENNGRIEQKKFYEFGNDIGYTVKTV